MPSLSNESTVIMAGISATLQLFRLSFDMIATASKKDTEISEKLENASRNELRASLSTKFFDGRFSLRRSVKQKGQQIETNTTGDSVENGEDTKADEEQNVPEEAGEKLSSSQKTLIRASLVFSVLALAYFITTCVLDAKGTIDALYDAIPLGCTAATFFLNSVVDLRDKLRQRFSMLQRSLYVLSAALLLLAIGFQLAIADEAPTNVDVASISLISVFTVLTLIECRLLPWPFTAVSDKKARLSTKSILLVLKPYFWPDATASSAMANRIRALATWVFVIGSKACALLSPIYLGTASTALARGDYESTIRNVVYYCLLGFASAVLKEAQSLVYLRVAQAAFVQLAELSFRHLHSLSLDWHLCKKLGEVIRSMDRGILACDTLVKYMFLWLIPAIAECILVAVIFATYFDDFALAATVFFFVFAYMILTVLLTLWRKKFRKQVAKSDNDWHDIATDSLINFETVKYFTAEDYEMKKFGSAVEAFQRGSVNVAASLSTLNISQRFLLQACLAMSLILTTINIRNRNNCCISKGCETGAWECCSDLQQECPGMEIGDFVAVLQYTINLFTPLNFLGSVYNAIVMAIVDLTNLSELLAENPDVSDAKDAIDMPRTNEHDSETVVEFDNVKFHYPSQPDSSGLKGVSFTMKRGTTTAIVGSTGAGKTTLSRLLFRFYDVTGGAVKVNGVDIRTVKQSDLRDMIGVVPQVATLFNDTLGENIAYGKKDATEAELAEAAEAAQLTNFIESLPDRYDTMVGDRGLKLSGGEKQRTAIARCILKNPSICIFDEATSALDTITEQSVKEALDRLGSDRTVLVIAHRLGTIKNADNIIVLHDGRINEQGTHEELLAKGGQYADMWNMQLSSTNTSQTSLGLDTGDDSSI